MATGATRYTNSGMMTETSAPGYYSGDNDMIDFYNEMARRRSQANQAKAAPRAAVLGGGRTVRPSSRQTFAEGAGAEGQQKMRILKAQAQKAQAEAAALSGKVPTRMSTVGGQTFATPDHLAMTLAQRQLALPQGSSFQNVIGNAGPSGERVPVSGGPFSEDGDEGGFQTVYGADSMETVMSPAEVARLRRLIGGAR